MANNALNRSIDKKTTAENTELDKKINTWFGNEVPSETSSSGITTQNKTKVSESFRKKIGEKGHGTDFNSYRNTVAA